MDKYQEAVKALLDTLAGKSGGGVAPSEPAAPQGIAGVAVFLEDGQVLFIGGGGK